MCYGHPDHCFALQVTVISVVDCPVRYDSFRRGVVAVPSDRTGIITMPSCEEAIRLAQYAKYSGWSPITGVISSDCFEQQFSQPLPVTFGRIPPEIEHVSLAGIHTVRTIEDILQGKVNSGFGIIFAMFTRLTVDINDVLRLVRLSCANCQHRMYPCSNEQNLGGYHKDETPQSSLFTCITPECPLSGQRFDPIDSEHLLIYFWMCQPGYDQPNPYLNVLACERPNPFEVYSSL
ncbi:unnamed protein product [Mesocestoides corti]|uniref:Uncharacterized protein n=1 Tax=Mesocestoides corti TaxID=53468 RepID=A0A158QTB8_MESCO|nr:unnamed protein product [Mesocestoides corti]